MGWVGCRCIWWRTLVALAIEDIPADSVTLPMSAVYPAASPQGLAGRWLIEALKQWRASPLPRPTHDVAQPARLER
jgi:hypothetical protein